MADSKPELFKNLKKINPDEKIVYCNRCVVSNQRPRITFNQNGICSACLWTEFKRKVIDWDKKEKELENLCDKFRSKDGSWDVIVPGSGGKDSAYQSHVLKYKYGMNPLTITWSPIIYTDYGYENWKNWLDEGGFDNILIKSSGKVMKKLTKLSIENLLHPFQTFFYGQKNLIPKIAAKLNIPLI